MTDETNHVMIYAGTNADGKKLWLHCTAGSGVVLNTPNYNVPYFRRVSKLNDSGL